MRTLVCLSLFLGAACADAEGKITAGEVLLEAREGDVELRLQRARVGDRPLLLITATVKPGAKIGVSPSTRPARLGDLAPSAGSFVAINGGFYDEKGAPMGLVVEGGKTVSRLRKGGGSGVFLVGAKGPRVVHRDKVPGSGVQIAVQSIDRVVDKGKSLVGERASGALDARSAVAVDKGGVVRLVSVFSPEAVAAESCDATGCAFTLDGKSSSSGVSLRELATYLVKTGAREALNLDGGYSTSFEARLQGKRVSVVAFGATVQAIVARP
jgi:uncharacterized protein YigE (DUF2233 family)